MSVTFLKPYATYAVGATVALDDSTEASLVAQGFAVYSVPNAGSTFPLTPPEQQEARSLLAGGVQMLTDTPQDVAASRGRIIDALTNRGIFGHRGLGGIATGTAATIPTPDPMAGSIGTDPEHELAAYIKGYALGIRGFEIDVRGANGYLIHDQDPRRVVRGPAWVTGAFYAANAYATNAGNVYRTRLGGTSGATAPTGTALTPISDGTVDWTWVAAALPTDVTTLSVAQYRDLTLTANFFMGPGYENSQCVLLRDLLRELGNKAMFIIEAKDAAAGKAIASTLREFNIATDMAAVASFTDAWVVEAKKLGYPHIVYTNAPADFTPAQIIAKGAIGVGTMTDWTAAEYASFRAAGLLCSPAPSRDSRTLRDLAFSQGANWITTDEPLYMSGQGAIDDGVWMDGRWPAGMLCEDAGPFLAQGGRGILKGTGTTAGWGFNLYTATPKGVLMGHFQLPRTFKRRFFFQIDSAPGAVNQGLWMAICAPNDYAYIDANGNYGNAYLIRLRKNGVMDIYKTTQGMTLGAANATATATGLGTDLQTNRCQFELERFWDGTANSFVKITNITGGNVSATYFDSEYVGPYMHMGRTQATYKVDTWVTV